MVRRWDEYEPGNLDAIGTIYSKKPPYYKNTVCAFDIETTRLEDIDHSIMYIWMLHLCGHTYTGRTWDEFLLFTKHLESELEKGEKLIIFVHNLSYEFQFLKGVYRFMPEDVFCVDSRKILRCDMYGKLEFRCSYLHSNMSLAEYTAKMGVAHAKLSGSDFDYSKKRYPWTPLTNAEMQYCIHDVVGLCEAIEKEMEHDGDTLKTIPLTSTGYVRRDARAAMEKIPREFVKKQLPDIETYTLLKECFRGGNTHASRYYANQIVKNVKSSDMSSAYPAAVCNCKFPTSEFRKIGRATFDEVKRLIFERHKAVLMRVKIYNLRQRDIYYGCPYLTRDKSRMIRDSEEYPAVYDNGRILQAGYLETSLTDIDFRIMLEEYDFDDIIFADVEWANYGKLPKPLIEETINYYRAKTTLKGVEGKEVYYMKSKNKLNSIYGMMVQDLCKDLMEYIENREGNTTGKAYEYAGTDKKELLNKANRRAFLAFQWGVWVTAHCRYRLNWAIKKAGIGFVYCDTDSVKYLGEIDFSDFNADRIAECKESGSYAADPNGVMHYMGVYEPDGVYSEFSTMGAKKYCYVEDGKLHATIAGVNKKKAPAELNKYGGIKAFKPGFVFRDAGGTESVYNDCEPFSHIADGREVTVTSNVCIRDSTYTLGLTAEYERLLQDSDILRKYLDRKRKV